MYFGNGIHWRRGVDVCMHKFVQCLMNLLYCMSGSAKLPMHLLFLFLSVFFQNEMDKTIYSEGTEYLSCVTRKPAFAYAKTKVQISCMVTAQLISALIFATYMVQFLFFLNLKFQASSHFLWLYSPVCIGPGRKP